MPKGWAGIKDVSSLWCGVVGEKTLAYGHKEASLSLTRADRMESDTRIRCAFV